MEKEVFDELKKEIEEELGKKKKRRAFTLYLSEENINFLKSEKVNVSRVVDRFLSSMIVFINSEKKRKQEDKEDDTKKEDNHI